VAGSWLVVSTRSVPLVAPPLLGLLGLAVVPAFFRIFFVLCLVAPSSLAPFLHLLELLHELIQPLLVCHGVLFRFVFLPFLSRLPPHFSWTTIAAASPMR
jgi:hypothetical protein